LIAVVIVIRPVERRRFHSLPDSHEANLRFQQVEIDVERPVVDQRTERIVRLFVNFRLQVRYLPRKRSFQGRIHQVDLGLFQAVDG